MGVNLYPISDERATVPMVSCPSLLDAREGTGAYKLQGRDDHPRVEGRTRSRGQPISSTKPHLYGSHL